MILVIFILTLFSPFIESHRSTLSKTDLLTSGSQKSWSITSMTPDERCSSSSDDHWIFFANGKFEFNHGTVTEDQPAECSDFVNIVGTWEFTNSETGLRVKALHEKGNVSNALTATMLDATIELLDDDQLRISQANPESGGTIIIAFTKN